MLGDYDFASPAAVDDAGAISHCLRHVVPQPAPELQVHLLGLGRGGCLACRGKLDENKETDINAISIVLPAKRESFQILFVKQI